MRVCSCGGSLQVNKNCDEKERDGFTIEKRSFKGYDGVFDVRDRNKEDIYK